ncbi:uncharacterized protein LOC8285979 isoform X2 [Ricinus communis]|nr:uncharacterized protein LOC8285979 isoform X2 [Ricinus communis]XP_048232084.1 uncharacterized protein LOC8285979 isoform X2 [Ricinus communis]|eukprot:XP_002526321.2 uncharacterized protein LOC8285979 [Ricinus communis]
MQHVTAQRAHHNVDTNNFLGHPDSYGVEAEHRYKSSKVEGRWQWNRDVQNVVSQMPSHMFNEDQENNGTRSYYQGHTPEPKLVSEHQANKHHEQDMDIGYEDNSLPLTFEVLEQRFLDEVTKLTTEQSDAEDAENARHREKISEINTRYQEKLSALRAQQANRREEFLCRESNTRLSQYHQAGMHYTGTTLHDIRGYSGEPASGATEEVHRASATNQFDSYRDQPLFFVGARNPANEGRIPYSEGRVYNNAGARYY